MYYSIKEFSKEVFKEFRVDITRTPTISYLAFRIFRSNFLGENNNIAVLNGHVYDFIYQGYYGGADDAYIPAGHSIKGSYVNYLYPTSMKINPMPVGNPYYFEGDLDYFNKINFNYPKDKNKILYSNLNDIFNLNKFNEFKKILILNLNPYNNKGVLCNSINLPYGILEVSLETPKKEMWNEPILLKKYTVGEGGIRTIVPVGNWKGVYFSEELYNAVNKNNSHNFKTNRGFLFRQGNLFKEYVEILFSLRINSPKDSPLNAISKLLLNSLYGRFGMNPEKPNHIILGDNNDKDKIYFHNEVTNIIDFGNGKELYTYTPKF